MTDSEDYFLSTPDIFGKDHLLSNFLQDYQPLSPVIETNFPSPASSTDSIDSPDMAIDPTVLQNLPMSVLQSLAAMYQQDNQQENFDQFVKFEEDLVVNHDVPVAAKPKTFRPPRQLECFNCHVTKTPLWRRTPDRAHSLCNACGLYYKQYGTHRPLHVRQKQQSSKPTTPPTPPSGSVTPVTEAACTSCHQSNIPLWRKSESSELLCNACSIYNSQKETSSNKRPLEEDDAQERPTKLAHYDTPALFPAAPSPVAVQSKEWAEIDDTRFKSLLSRMNTQQMHGFLGMLERRCSILRSILTPESK